MFSDWMRFRFRLRYSGDGPVAGDLSLDVVSAKATVRIPTSDFYASSLGDITQRGDQISGDLDHASDRLDTPKPDLDDINVDVVPDAGLNSINSVLSIITSNLNVLNVMVMTATLMMVSYIFFGKRG